MKIISLKVADSFDSQLTTIVRQRGMSKSALICGALETFLKAHPNGEKGSALSLSEALAGCLSGPEDLSVNKDYLRGFGR